MVEVPRAPRSGSLARCVRLVSCIGLMSMCGSALADEAKVLPFFSEPYPSGFARPTVAPEYPCWQFRRVDTLLGSYIERVWVCGTPIRERY